MTMKKRIFISLAGVLALAITSLAIMLSYNAECPTPASSTQGPQPLMKAVMQRCYGSPEMLTLEEIPKPTPADNEVLVRVQAAAVNPLDWHGAAGVPYVMRLGSGLGTPKDPRTGVDFAGTVESVGKQVTRFKPGDEVFGGRGGAFAEYVVVPEDRAIAAKPSNVTFEQAAAIPIAAVTALQALRDQAHVQAGQRVLINGASGGVGTFAVQIAKSFGAEVTGVCSTRNVELVRTLGADHVIDYKKEGFTTANQRYDVIIDNVGNHSPLKLRQALTPNGAVVIVGAPKDGPWIGTFMGIIKGTVLSWFVPEKFVFFVARLTQDDLTFLARLAGEGKMTAVIDRNFTLGEVPAAIEYLAGWHARGKVVVRVPPDTAQSQKWKPTPNVVSNVFNESSKRSMTLSR
ncbi:NADPH:quinone reductase [Steroidobacter agaridevorans]|uniref:NADPH:quinone reductase n=2 Tax=Steroidobacter agaridevorans TaxID=2695856 RepID=A0A829YA00_9GAMM|nr:NAD(P)-dependent alcohol dehydrogenase [Steroidobacter agaridevorans]GFE80000.1 NADPH:quinone reductase [Steroidobacter agaridevorans]GFE90030.1 NADPH:quinone reductase [Steroidobacter agaridevorans]